MTRTQQADRGRAVRAAALLAALTLLAGTLTWPPTPAAAGGRTAPADDRTTTVSLSFDDGYANQRSAARMLSRMGISATFYLNSALLGDAGYVDASWVRRLEAQGHEVGGHSRTHADLAELDDDALWDQVCGDRETLQEEGAAPVTFAYPYGSWDDRVVDVVQSCGYQSARTASGLRGRGTGCRDCPVAESLDPLDHRFNIRTHRTVRRTDTWQHLASLVRRVEDQGGGWVPLVFHRVCDDCAAESTTRRTIRRLAEWLLARPSTTVVVPVGAAVAAADEPGAAADGTTGSAQAASTGGASAAASAPSGTGGGSGSESSARTDDLADVQVQVLLWGTVAFVGLVCVLRYSRRRSEP